MGCPPPSQACSATQRSMVNASTAPERPGPARGRGAGGRASARSRMPKLWASARSASMSTLARCARGWRRAAAWAKAGAMAWQGPHQVAQKSTSSGRSLPLGVRGEAPGRQRQRRALNSAAPQRPHLPLTPGRQPLARRPVHRVAMRADDLYGLAHRDSTLSRAEHQLARSPRPSPAPFREPSAPLSPMRPGVAGSCPSAGTGAPSAMADELEPRPAPEVPAGEPGSASRRAAPGAVRRRSPDRERPRAAPPSPTRHRP